MSARSGLPLDRPCVHFLGLLEPSSRHRGAENSRQTLLHRFGGQQAGPYHGLGVGGPSCLLQFC